MWSGFQHRFHLHLHFKWHFIYFARGLFCERAKSSKKYNIWPVIYSYVPIILAKWFIFCFFQIPIHYCIYFFFKSIKNWHSLVDSVGWYISFIPRGILTIILNILKEYSILAVVSSHLLFGLISLIHFCWSNTVTRVGIR